MIEVTKWAETMFDDNNEVPNILREIYFRAAESVHEIEDEALRKAVLAVKTAFEEDVRRKSGQANPTGFRQ